MTDLIRMTREALAGVPKTETTRDCVLNIVVIRLLAVAAMVASRRTSVLQGGALALPDGYRRWPGIESETDSSGAGARNRFYVCPAGAGTADEEAFPVGTVLVVETYVNGGRGQAGTHLTARAHLPPHSIFVMKKYASVHDCGATGCPQEGWAFTTYGHNGSVLPGYSAKFGVCRLALI
jgi:hypothetical protein